MSYQTFQTLQKQVTGLLSQSKSDNNCLKVIKLCRGFIAQNNSTSSTYRENSINEVVKYKKPDVEKYLFDTLKLKYQSTNVIRSYLVEQPVPHSKYIFEAVKENRDLQLNRTALRQLLYRKKDVETSLSLIKANRGAFEVVELKKFQKIGLIYFAGVLSFNGILEIAIVGHEAVHLIFDIYFFNLFLGIFFLKRQNSDIITWRPGISLFQKYFHHYEYRMCDKLMTLFKELYTTNVTNYHMANSKLIESFQSNLNFDKEEIDRLVRNEFRQMGLMIPEDSKEAMFKEYWSTGGDGFEWTEPDRDPVEFLDINITQNKENWKM